ncbi:Uncharacterised protein [Bordetella pertussis]|nr:Uncharacterised protein [Bordetella pertussis]
MAHAQPFERGGDARVALGRRQALLLQAECQVLAHDGKDNLVLWILEYETDPATHVLDLVARIQAVDQHPPGGRQGQAVDQPRQRALARAIGADHPHAAFGQAQAHAMQDLCLGRGDDRLVKLD